MDLTEQLSEILVDRQDLVEAVRALVTEKEGDITAQGATISALEEKVSGYEEVLSSNSKAIEGYRDEVEHLKGELGQAVESYRQAILVAAPDLPVELVSGGSIAEIDASLESARKVVEKVKERFELQNRAAVDPAGAPARREPDVNAMTAREKIEYGLRAGARG